jgi:hypothetical protein
MAEPQRNPDELLAESLQKIEATLSAGEPADPDAVMALIDAQTREVQSLIVHLMADLSSDPQPLAEVNAVLSRAVTDVLTRSPRPLVIRSVFEPALMPLAQPADALHGLFRRCLELLRAQADDQTELEVATASSGLGARVSFQSTSARAVPQSRLASAREFAAELGGRLRTGRTAKGFRIEIELESRAPDRAG